MRWGRWEEWEEGEEGRTDVFLELFGRAEFLTSKDRSWSSEIPGEIRQPIETDVEEPKNATDPRVARWSSLNRSKEG